jgi:hypothetical protein
LEHLMHWVEMITDDWNFIVCFLKK